MLLLRDRGIRSRVQITGFSLSVCRVCRLVEIVDSYPCDHCYVCLIISLINLIPFGLLRNRFIKNAIRSNVLINCLNFCYLSVSEFYLAVRTILKTV